MAEALPQLPDSVFLPGMEMTCGERILKDAVKKKFGRVVTIGRAAILTRQHNGRAAGHYCGPCEQEWNMSLSLWAECLARKENYVELDRDRVDAWGIPIPKIHAEYGENEKKLFEDGRQQAAEMIEAAGAKNVHLHGNYSVPGFCIHEVGTARMGNNPKTSVVNRYCQTHDVPNIFVTDGAYWVSSGCQNPTLTMMAITVRACDYIKREYAKVA